MKTRETKKEIAPERKAFMIDCEPKWEEIIMLLAINATNGSEDARQELLKVARIADAVRAEQK